MIRIRIVAAFLVLLAGNAPAQALSESNARAWLEDIAYWEQQLREIHIAPFHSVSEEDFRDALATIRANVGQWPDYAVALELIRVAAAVGDGHTYLFDGGFAGIFTALPIAAHPFADGVFILNAMPEQEDLVGSEILTIEGTLIDGVVDTAEPYVPRDNEWTVLARYPWLIVCPEFLHWKGFATDLAAVTMGIRDPDGVERDVTLKPVPGADHRAWRESWAPRDDAPSYRKEASTTYWKVYLEDANAVYMQFNAVRNMEGGPHLTRFSRNLIEFVDENDAEYLIIDVRHNGGGDGNLLKPLIRRIAEHPRVNRPGHLYVLTSRYTFSAALMFTARMERQTHVLFAGEPGSGKPNSYSEYNGIGLPNSGLRGSVSSLWHEEGLPEDTRAYIDVDFAVPTFSRDWFENRDPVLDAVLARISKIALGVS